MMEREGGRGRFRGDIARALSALRSNCSGRPRQRLILGARGVVPPMGLTQIAGHQMGRGAVGLDADNLGQNLSACSWA